MWQISIADRFDPQQFQKTEAIKATVTAVTMIDNGYVLTVRVANQSRAPADHIVLTARLIDNRQNTVAVNPLVAIQQLASNEYREINIRFPTVAPVAGMEGRIEVSLVRWADE